MEKRLRILVAGMVAGALAACSGGVDGISLDTGNQPEETAPPEETVDRQEPIEDAQLKEDNAVIPPPDVRTKETEAETQTVDSEAEIETPKDIQDKEEISGEPSYLPDELKVVWTNVENMDMVTVRKNVVLEFETETRMPENKAEIVEYNKAFEAHLYEWDADKEVVVAENKIKISWRHILPGKHRKPALVIEPLNDETPLQGLVATTPYKVTVHLGQGKYFERVFHTLPMWTPGYKLVQFEVPVEDCERCFPFPVTVSVFIPPEYNSPDPEYNNNSLPWGNTQQRYPVLVGLHGYNGQGMSMADAYGYKTLPRFSSQGVVEPTILILSDGTVPQPYCGEGWEWPGAGKTCYTQFMGIGAKIPEYKQFTCYSYFMAHTMLKYIGQFLRIRGQDNGGYRLDDEGEVIEYEEEPNLALLKEQGRTWDYFRRGHGITGLSGGGFAALINAFAFADTWGSVYGLVPTTPSFFNPYAYWYSPGTAKVEISQQQICNQAGNAAYPYQPLGSGFWDRSMIDPATDRCRVITLDMREIWGGGKTCFWFSPPAVSNAIVINMLCGLDATCMTDPGIPEKGIVNPWHVDFERFPFDGNILFSTGIRDFEGPPAAFFDLDQQLDRQGIIHDFWYMDSGGVYHDWQSIYDQVVGRYVIDWQDGTQTPGNFPGTGKLYPFMNSAYEGLGNPVFNHPFASDFTNGALDPDRDHHIDFAYEGVPDDLKYVDDNCPGVTNLDQLDTDNDAFGDECDEDDDGDGIFDVSDNCPLIPNPGQEDSDLDGIGEPCDKD
jgi:hypothetical protein